MVKTTIYKLVCKYPLVTDCYVGRSKDVIARLTQHQICCYNEVGKNYNYKIYKIIRANGGFENWTLMEIETIEHSENDKLLPKEREAFWFHKLNSSLNKNVPNQPAIVSQKNWRLNNPNYFKEYSKQYAIKNKEKISEKMKKYYQDNKEHMNALSAKWINENREHNREYQRERCRKIAAAKKALAIIQI